MRQMSRKKWNVLLVLFIAAGALIISGCVTPEPLLLEQWNDNTQSKNTLLDYVRTVTNPESAEFIPVENRIAVFDLDGTLFLETDPTYFDWALFEHRVLEDPNFEASEEQIEVAKAARNGRLPTLNKYRERLVSEAYKGMTINAFEAFVRKFMEEEQPGFNGLKRGEAFYKPMVELVEYLTKNDFTVYVISGTDRLTVRPLAATLNIPPKQIIGSDSTILASGQGEKDGLDYTFSKGDKLILGGKNLVKNLQMNKVAVIAQEIGMQPVLAFGNSSTDASMLNYAIYANKYKALGFMVLCDDLIREYGNAEKANKMRRDCEFNGWIPISMRDDWKTIYGKEVTKKTKK